MRMNASTNSFDAASASAAPAQSTSSPFSPHATAFGPTAILSLGTSNRVHGIASDGQSLSSRASSFTSTHDHASASGPNGANPNLPSSPLANIDAHPSSAALFSFGDRIRHSDHSRQSSVGAMSSFSTASATGGAGAGVAAARRTQSPLPQQLAARTNLTPTSFDSFAPPQASGANARSPTSLVPPYQTEDPQRRLSSSFGARSDSPSLAPPVNGARPPFGRQSFSDGPSASATNLLSTNASSASTDARHGSFSGSFSPAAGEVTASTDSQLAQITAPAPTTGPLSASDPRTQLLVSNLPYRVRWQDLKDLFRKAGTVLRADVSLSADNRSRGYGTVLMATEQDAIKAADMLGGFTWQGRTLDVRVDRSGTLVGVAGSAVMPTIANNGFSNSGVSSPNTFATGQMASNPNPFSLDQPLNSQQFLGVPSGVGAGSSQSPGSYSGNASPLPLSPLARAVDHSQARSARASFSQYSDSAPGGSNNQPSEFERAMLQGQSMSGATGRATPSRQRPGSNFDAGFGGQPQHRAISAVQSLNSNSMASRRGSEGGVGVGMLGGASPSAGMWGAAATDVASSLHSQNAGGSSVPTGFPGATAMAPWPAGPGSLGAHGMASMQSQPFNSQMPTTSYAGRVLFVGNLPFHCQWQDLKDLFRAAGNIQRADVAIGPDGRSRGFGTVLFASQEDAQNAVRLYHGYEYSGRTLKVHFDRFAAQNGPAIGTPGNPAQYTGAFAAAALPSHMTTNTRAPALPPAQAQQPMQGAFGQHQYSLQHQHQQSQQRGGAAMAFIPQQQAQTAFGQPAFQHQNPASLQFGSQYQSLQMQQQQAHHPQQAQRQQQPQQPQQQQQQQQQQQMASSGFAAFTDAGRALQAHLTQQSFSAFGSSLDPARQNAEGGLSDLPASSTKPFGLYTESGDAEEEAEPGNDRENNYGMSITLPSNGGFGAASSYLPSDLMSPGLVSPPAPTQLGATTQSHPGRIQLPAASFANSFGAAVGAAQADQMSPMTARMHVPMTPGMPGFTFHQVPETPPLYPQFLSPGLGPFSPTVGGSSQMGSGAAIAPQNVGMGAVGGGFMNVAPGAPVNAAAAAATPGAPAGYNPMFPVAAAYGTQQQPQQYQQQAQYRQPHQQQQPATPHWSQTSGPRRGGTTTRASFGMSHNTEADEVVDDVRANIAKTPGAGPRRPSHADHVLARRASDGTPGATTEPSITDGYPFPMVATGPVAHLTRRASTNSPAGTPLAGPAGSRQDDSATNTTAANNTVSSNELLAGTSAEELANTIARMSVKGTALAKDGGSKRSLSMTAERSAASAAMAKLREKADTPTPPAAQEGTDEEAPASASTSTASMDHGVMKLGAPFQSVKPSPLATTTSAATNQVDSADSDNRAAEENNAVGRLLGLRGVSDRVLEAARNGSALDTGSEAGGSRKSTPQDEFGSTTAS